MAATSEALNKKKQIRMHLYVNVNVCTCRYKHKVHVAGFLTHIQSERVFTHSICSYLQFVEVYIFSKV